LEFYAALSTGYIWRCPADIGGSSALILRLFIDLDITPNGRNEKEITSSLPRA
jgi:hypothetical protein